MQTEFLDAVARADSIALSCGTSDTSFEALTPRSPPRPEGGSPRVTMASDARPGTYASARAPTHQRTQRLALWTWTAPLPEQTGRMLVVIASRSLARAVVSLAASLAIPRALARRPGRALHGVPTSPAMPLVDTRARNICDNASRRNRTPASPAGGGRGPCGTGTRAAIAPPRWHSPV